MQRAVLWVAFLLVHGLLIWLNLALSFPQLGQIERPLGDVENYRHWVAQAFEHGEIVGISSPWVYPILALPPMLLAGVFGAAPYVLVWLLSATVVNAIAFVVLLGRGAFAKGRRRAAWWWLAFLLLIGPVTLARLDGLTMAIAVVALLLALRHPRLAAAVLTIAAWMKVWPAALIASLVLAHRRRLSMLAVVGVLSGIIVIGCLVGGAGANVLSFISSQSGRGVQLEAPIAMPWLVAVAMGNPDWRIEWDAQLLTYQVVGPGAAEVAAATTWLLAAGVLAVGAAGVLAVRRGARVWALLPQLSVALVCVLILGNKVGSPQYVVWLAAPVVLGLVLATRRWIAAASILLLIAALTQVIYPFGYAQLLHADLFAVGVLALKYLLTMWMLIWALAAMLRLGRHPTRHVGDGPQSGAIRLG